MNVAHKNADKPKFSSSKEEKFSRISFDIECELKRDFHIACINSDKNMAEVIISLIRGYVRSRK